MKKFKKLFFTVIGAITFLFFVAILVGWYYKDEVAKYVVRELNKSIETEIFAEKIDFSVIRKFPNASVEFRNVIVLSTSQFNKHEFPISTDTLMQVRNVFLEFNVLDLIRKNYKIKNIHVNAGKIRLLIDQEGQTNYNFWMKAEKQDDLEHFGIDLQSIRFTRVELGFINNAKNTDLQAYIERLDMRGNFAAEKYSLGGRAIAFAYHFKRNGVNYLKPEKISLNLNLDVNKNLYTITDGSIEVAAMSLNINGNYLTGDGNINLMVGSENIKIGHFISLFPELFKNLKKDYSTDGKMLIKASVTGKFNKLSSPRIEADFNISDALLSKRGTKIKLEKIQANGQFTNGHFNNPQTSVISLSNFNGIIGDGYFDGNLTLKNFITPEIALSLKSQLNLAEIQQLFPHQQVEKISGAIEGKINAIGYLADMERFSFQYLKSLKLNGNISLDNVNLKLKEKKYTYSDINGNIDFYDDIKLNNVSLAIADHPFTITGTIENGMAYLFEQNKMLTIDARIYAPRLNTDVFLEPGANKKTSSIASDNQGKVNFPENVALNLQFAIGQYNFGRFSATNVKGFVNYKPKMFVLRSMTFETMGGKLAGGGVVIQKHNGNLVVKTQSTLHEIDINQLFYSFNNFSQNFIKEENLKGTISGNVDLSVEWTKHLKLIKESIVAESSIEIKNGELIAFEPMLGLSRFIEVSELSHIKFSTLQNEIFIKDRIITIPKMDIYSSAMNLTASGTHDFDNFINYKIKVLLSDVLSKKAKRAKKENTEFGIVEDDGLGRTSLFLSITGNVDDYKVSYDRRGAVEAVIEDLRDEKKQIKTILNEEFGWFKQENEDTTKKTDIQSPTTGFKIDWDDADDDHTKKYDQPVPPPEMKNSPGFQIEWDDD